MCLVPSSLICELRCSNTGRNELSGSLDLWCTSASPFFSLSFLFLSLCFDSNRREKESFLFVFDFVSSKKGTDPTMATPGSSASTALFTRETRSSDRPGQVGLPSMSSITRPQGTWPYLPHSFAFLASLVAVPMARGLSREPFLRRPWAYPAAAVFGWGLGLVAQRADDWEKAESVRLEAMLREKHEKMSRQRLHDSDGEKARNALR
jgi:hypothetical protein